ncbi:hypothetical protein [Nannocystis exedens]|uniref:hypothetical protein n=1 Tax=Nannocystis exedens TaxID=54 RepID=UPI001FE6E7A7|nr:hypothetical protein [Nannocystis exedens]
MREQVAIDGSLHDLGEVQWFGLVAEDFDRSFKEGHVYDSGAPGDGDGELCRKFA